MSRIAIESSIKSTMANGTNETNSAFIENTNITIVTLEFFQCFMTDFPESHIDCSLRDPSICLKCEVRSAYLTGESVSQKSSAHLFCVVMLLLSIAVGIVGIFLNALTILVIQKKKIRSNKIRAFEFLILCLAYADFLCCVSSIGLCVALIYNFDNIHGSDRLILYCIYISMMVLQICRSASFHITLLITLERFLLITYPLRSQALSSQTKSKVQVLCVVAYVVLLCVPRYTSLSIGENIFNSQEGHLNVPSLVEFEYIYRPTKWLNFWLKNLGKSFDFCAQFLEYWVPNVGLLVLNVCLVDKVQRIRSYRPQLSRSQQKEIKIARMFVPVVVIVLLCCLGTFVAYMSTYFTKTFYREIWIGVMLTYQVNSSANFVIYYIRRKEFRIDTRITICNFINKVKLRSAA